MSQSMAASGEYTQKIPVRMEFVRCCPNRGWAAAIFLMAARIRHRTVERAFSVGSRLCASGPESGCASEFLDQGVEFFASSIGLSGIVVGLGSSKFTL